MEKLSAGLSHLFMTVFLYCFSGFMVIPAITDVTMSAVCPGKDECSLAIYLTGFQQAIIGLGSLVMMPLVGNLSDRYGRKVMLTVPMTLSIFPLAVLAYSRTKGFFYAYCVLRTLISMVTEGSVQCLALAYVADNVPESKRVSIFGILSGIASCAFVCGNLSTRFLSTSAVFQVAAGGTVISLVYMRMFLPESMSRSSIVSEQATETDSLLEKSPKKTLKLFKTLPSLKDTISMLRTSKTFSQAAVISFFSTVAEVGAHSSLLYYLKAQFHFDKDQFADLMIINGIAGTVSQMLLYSIAWASWVPYAAAVLSLVAIFAMPCLRSIASKEIGPCEQGKAQGCLTGICSFAQVVCPLAFSPLTALFLSESAPFHFPGFSILCAAFAAMIAFAQSIAVRTAQPGCIVEDFNSVEP
ncbi:uncharacterized protein LOC113749745 isoform X2 [Coffea eugenioides]|uniref:uncharacterized protein LOC113749745 isoform X2 n=1 Tax=Coffea eugenioides TaxID=49369 RepID=UPI000F610696|nr:uncharacterized protein LOC113749745 isoform X2 [Coffea eugenioides]